MANTLSDLNKVFEQIDSKLTEYKCSNVSITDSLSQWAELTEKSGTPVSSITGNYTIKITNASGIEQTVPEGTTVTYDSSTKQVKLTLPASYELQSGYTYAITFRVRPTDAAFQDYAANGAYPDIGDTGTGASSVGKAGYDSNTEALLRYTYKDSAKTESYAVPVLQLNGTVSVTKTAEGLPTESADNGPVSIL